MKITLQDFKNHKEESFDIEGSTAIRGRNGSGKTSILEAIMFALYGRNFSKGIALDGYVAKGRDCTSVVLETGAFKIKRRYCTKSGSSVFFNGKQQKQMEVAAKLPPMDLAYAVVNPLSLLQDTAPLELRAFFMENIDLEDPVELFKKHYSEDPQLIERFRIGDFEQIKRVKRTLENTMNSLEKDIAIKEGDIVANKAEIQKIERVRVRRPKGVLKREQDRQKEIDKYKEQLGELKGLKIERQSIKDQLNLMRKGLAEPLEKAGVDNISELVAYHKKTVDEVSDEYRRVLAQVELRESMRENFNAKGNCPLCNQSLEGLDIRDTLSKQITLNRKLLEGLRETLDSRQDALETAQEVKDEIQDLKSRKEYLENRISRFKRVKEKLEVLQAKQKGLGEEDFRQAVEAQAQTRMLTNLRKRVTDATKKIEQNRESVKKTKKELDTVELLYEALSPQGVSALQAREVGKVIAKELAEYFPKRKVEVDTVRENKTNDNYREVFDITIDGVHYTGLSFGERIVIGVVLSLLLRKCVGTFPFNFMLLDEASVLSAETLKTILSEVHQEGISLVFTEASNEDLNLVGVT